MEKIKKLLKQNEDYFMISDESDSEDETLTASNPKHCISDALNLKAFGTMVSDDDLTFKKRKGKERLPTRRPDPNVYNRNALLARENRRKKKIYLETIEKELQLAREANRLLLKALKHQMKIRHQLEEEKLHFKGLISERSEHLHFDQASKSPNTSETETNKSFSTSISFGSLNLLNSADECPMTSCSSSILEAETGSVCVDSTSDGTVNDIQQNSSFDFTSFDFYTFPGYLTDLENEVSCLQTTSLIWDDIYGKNGTTVDYFIKQDSSIAQKNNVLRNVNNDHCYVTNSSGLKMTKENYLNSESMDTSEMCSHHTNGEFLEIFCPTCSKNPECRTPPMQLLDDTL